MTNANREGLEQMLRDLIRSGRAGDRLPTVRSMMSRFGISQGVVQSVLEVLRGEKLISAQVGRGTFVAVDGEIAPSNSSLVSEDNTNLEQGRSVLMLSRHAATARSRQASRELQKQLSEDGIQSLQVTYSDVDHALLALRALPKFDACVLQSHFELVNIDLLWFLRQRSRIIVLDGATITGIDVDSVASDWRSALDLALQHLFEQGHQKIAFATSSAEARPIDATRQHYESMRRWGDWEDKLLPPILLDHVPGEERVEEIQKQLVEYRGSDGKPEFSALMIWGVTNGEILLDALSRLDWRIPEDVSVVLLGHVDVESEHKNFFTVAGTCAMDAVKNIQESIQRRLTFADASYRTVYLEAVLDRKDSVKMLPAAKK
ncbi:hypothetical protein A9Q83_11515 [Alphaproteobacteria bacterium 46_93_T64]|nr:hypothetical protein A9Q83_11515 [Alphaproteobacteria bacterium 46_93_T64]